MGQGASKEGMRGWLAGRTDGGVGRREKSLSTVCAGAVSALSPSTTRWASNRRPDSGATGGCRGSPTLKGIRQELNR